LGIVPEKDTRRWPGNEDFKCPKCGQPYIDDGDWCDGMADMQFSCHKCLHVFTVVRIVSMEYEIVEE
jgi:hypothetical protein